MIMQSLHKIEVPFLIKLPTYSFSNIIVCSHILPYGEKISRTNIFTKFTTEEQFVKNTVNENVW